MVRSVWNPIRLLGPALALCLLVACTQDDPEASASEDRDRPNVVFILADDLGWKDLGSYGSDFYDTPNLDTLAREGIRFTDAYSAHPVCSPTRAALMTGKDPVRVNITDWITGMDTERATDPQLVPPEDRHNLPLDEVTVAEAFKEHGYRTFFAGKWHLGEKADHWPKHQGFDINKGGFSCGSPGCAGGGYYSPYENPRLEDGPEGEYLTDRMADESIQFMEDAAGDPFFLFLSFYTVHTPIEGAEQFDAFYKEKKASLPNGGAPEHRPEGPYGQTRLNQTNYKYAAMVRSMDHNVGRILDRLESLDLTDNTIVVFTSDNGGLSTLKGDIGPTAVTPLRAGKGWAYEGGTRVPLIVRGPGLPEGELSRQPVTSMDYYPTLLELAGLPPREQQHVDGQSIVPYLENPDRVDERTLVWHYPHYHGSTWRPGSAIREGDWKLIEFYEQEDVELYDLNSDPLEQNDLSDAYPEKAKALREKMHDYIQERDGQYPEPRE